MAATGAMLIARGTYEVAKRMADQDTTYDGGTKFVLTHKPPDEPDPTVTFLNCGLEEAVAGLVTQYMRSPQRSQRPSRART